MPHLLGSAPRTIFPCPHTPAPRPRPKEAKLCKPLQFGSVGLELNGSQRGSPILNHILPSYQCKRMGRLAFLANASRERNIRGLQHQR